MIDQAPSKTLTYPQPTLDEMIGLATDFGILSQVIRLDDMISLEVLGEAMHVSTQDAGILLKGLLLGYFYNQSRDDLSLARWKM